MEPVSPELKDEFLPTVPLEMYINKNSLNISLLIIKILPYFQFSPQLK